MPVTQKRKIVLCLLRAQHATKWLCVIVVVYLVFEMFDLILTVEYPILCNMTIKLIFFPFLLPYLFIFSLPAFLFSPPSPTPYRSGPGGSGPARAGPVRSGRVRSGPGGSGPVRAGPVRAGPV